MDVLFLIAGIALLVVGAELLVTGAVQLARRIGASELMIGVLVGIGTSAPELVTSLRAALGGSGGMALGNVVGANVANMLLVLGICALLQPLQISARSLRLDGSMVVFSAAIFAILTVLFPLSRWLGGFYLVLLAIYLYRAWQIERKGPKAKDRTAPIDRAAAAAAILPIAHEPKSSRDVGIAVLQTLGGLAIVILGAHWIVESASAIARTLRVSESVIGLTIVAIGTTLPELATSVAAIRRKSTEVAVGNVFGSFLYNILGIAGLIGVLAPMPVPPQIAYFAAPVMLASALILFTVAWSGFRISRREAFAMISIFVIYNLLVWRV
jgi:cation:H+ antiporter